MMNDLIGRQAAVELVMKYCPDDDGTVQCVGDIRELLDELENLPLAQPEPKEGHWIMYDKRFPWRTWYKCSECGNYLDFSGVNGGRVEPHYCPNCGAKMKGEMI